MVLPCALGQRPDGGRGKGGAGGMVSAPARVAMLLCTAPLAPLAPSPAENIGCPRGGVASSRRFVKAQIQIAKLWSLSSETQQRPLPRL